ncbi:exported hypothetical protein [Candidatus Zixiibacteriota bacterium]|nr:exported hypothetical protein [candidate division Zixibacteria bacterium]
MAAKIIPVITAMIFVLAGSVAADDLFQVKIKSTDDAERLRNLNTNIILKTLDGYLVLADRAAVSSSGLECRLLASDVTREELYLDQRFDDKNLQNFSAIFKEDNVRLFRLKKEQVPLLDEENQIYPLPELTLEPVYREPEAFRLPFSPAVISLDSLAGLVSQDIISANTHRLEAFYRRLTGSDSDFAARDWISDKFIEYGYDSVVYDNFYGFPYGYVDNVIAYKPGTERPDLQIIVGAHRDAGSVSPGADDNGTGSAGVLEMARVLKDIPTAVTFIFILFDGEEQGLDGSWHYADEAKARGDSILYMLNMDMIAHYQNIDRANLYYGPVQTYSQLWAHLADSLFGITATFKGTSGGSDHYPFIQNGYQATFVQEGIFSTVYHTARDSTTYLNFEYMKRMVQASLATVYSVDASRRTPYICGDVDNSGYINILDIAYIIRYLYRDGMAPFPLAAADADGNGAVNILDVSALIDHLYRGGPTPICD